MLLTNICGIAMITVSTNFESAGVFTPKRGTPQEVFIDFYQTNTTIIFVWEGQEQRFDVKKERGPDIRERRAPRPFPERSVGGGTNAIVYPPSPR